MIAYKVVEKQTRHCSNWTLFKAHWRDLPQLWETANKFRRENREWFPRYLRGKTVKAAPGSIGILCFNTIAAAKRFDFINFAGTKCKTVVIKVKGYGLRPGFPHVVGSCGDKPNKIKDVPMYPAPSGSVAFDKVKVLE